MMSSMFLKDMHDSLNRLMDVEKQMSSQQLYSKPSDNPSEVSRGMTVKTSISRNEQYQRNLDDAVTWLSNTETAMGQITDIVSSVKEQTIYAGNGALSDVDKDAIAKDIAAMRDELMQIANFNVEGRYLLAGLQTSEKPFVKDENGEISYIGDLEHLSFELEENVTGSISLNGRDVFPTSFPRRSVESIEVPLDFKWKGGSEVLQISVGNKTDRVLLPQRWNDSNISSSADPSDHDGLLSPGEEIRGYSLTEVAELINSSEGAGKLVHADVKSDSLSGTQTIEIRSLSGEELQVSSFPWEENQEKGEFLCSDTAGIGWSAVSDGNINLKIGTDKTFTIDVSVGDNLSDVADSLSALDGIWAGVRNDGSITMVAEDSTDPFSVNATGVATDLFSSSKTSSPVSAPMEMSHTGLSSFLGLSTAVTSTEWDPTETFDLSAEPMDMIFRSGERVLELDIQNGDLNLEQLAERIKAAGGDWLEVIYQQDSAVSNPTDTSVSDLESATCRLMIRTKDGSELNIYDKENHWAKKLGLQTALTTSDLSSIPFPDTAGPEVPVKIGVEIGDQMHEVKIYREDVVDPSGNLLPRELALQVVQQVGSDKIGFETVTADPLHPDMAFSLYSLSGEPLRVVDLPYSYTAHKDITSGLAMDTGLQSGITCKSVGAVPAGHGGTFTIISSSKEISLSVSDGESLDTIASRIEDLAGSWLDVSLAEDGGGNYRLALSPKDGSPVNVYDESGSAAVALQLNTDVRVQAGTWPGGGVFSVSIDGYTHEMDLTGLSTLQEMEDLVNARFSEEDIHAQVVDNGGTNELVLYSPVGKDISIKGAPAGVSFPLGQDTTDRGANESTGPSSQNLVIRSGSNVEEGDLFDLLNDLAISIEQGSRESLSESFLPKLDQAMDEILKSRSYCGALQRRYETASMRLSENNISLTELESNIMDVDMAEAAMEFQTSQTVYQATLATIAKVIQPTLVDYLA